MDFYEVVDQVVDLLRRRGRVTYRALKAQFQLDDEQLETLKEEILYAHDSAIQADDRGFIWTDDKGSAVESTPAPSILDSYTSLTTEPERGPLSYTPRHLAEKILTSRSALEGERKQVTVLFCDLANSTAIAEKIGPEAMHTLLNRFFELALSEVHRYEGTINQFLGDGFMALFGAPISHEDHARRGVLSALSLQRTLKEADLGKPYGVECAFRMGLNSGLVVVGSIGDNLRMDYSAIGDTTNLASRLQQQAEPGNILIHETTARLVQSSIRLEALAPVEVRGKMEPVFTYKVIGTLPRRSPVVSRGERTLSQFVGRERELAVLDELFHQVESGQGQVVGIVAEAGGGKSRLLYEFRQGIQDKRVTYLEGRCLSYGSTIPYHPIIDVVRNNCGITETDSPEAINEKVRDALQEVGMEPEEFSPYVLQLIGVKEGTESIAVLTPEAIRTRTFDTLKQMSLKGSQQRPLIFEIEDLHWIDNTSQDYLTSLVESLAGGSILLLTSYRPGYRPAWLEQPYATQISLHNLTPHDALNVVHSIRQNVELPEHLEQTIIEKAEGNPFFLEELTRAVMEHGDAGTARHVPDTIQGVLSARIDRLPDESKRLLQTASILGREFSPTLLKAIWEDTAPFEPLLSELKRLEFFFERTGAEERLYIFKHALTQEVAYDSLLTTRRQALHTAAGQALESLYAHRLEDAYNHLAHHYANADHTAKAVEYLTFAADRAIQGHAHAEAVASLQKALVHAQRLPVADQDRFVLHVVLRYALSLFYLGRLPDSLDLLLQHQERLERLQEPLLAGRYAFRMSLTYSLLGYRERATQYAQQALEEGERCGDVITIGMAHYLLAVEGFWSGNFVQGVKHGEQAVSLLEQTQEQYWFGQSQWAVGFNRYFIGEFERALDAYARTCTIGAAIGDARLQSYAAWSIGLSHAARGDWERGIQACQQGLEKAPDAFTTAVALGFLGFAYLEASTPTAACHTLEQAVAHMSHVQLRQCQGLFMIWLGEAWLLKGDTDKASTLASQGIEIVRNAKYRYGVGWAQRLLSRIAYSRGNLIEAMIHLQEALATFSSIQSRYDLTRTHLDLALLAHTQDNQDTTTTHLSTAYAWFKKLQVPKWVERTEQLAREYGVTLTEVELKELTEEPS
jgi:predicted ATPase/class 3 adenylate cyclase